jgi:hypothetical protein
MDSEERMRIEEFQAAQRKREKAPELPRTGWVPVGDEPSIDECVALTKILQSLKGGLAPFLLTLAHQSHRVPTFKGFAELKTMVEELMENELERVRKGDTPGSSEEPQLFEPTEQPRKCEQNLSEGYRHST